MSYFANTFTIIHGINLEKLVIILVPSYNDKSTCFELNLISLSFNEKRSFVLKNLTSDRIRASRIATYKTSAKYCKVLFIYGVFKL